MMQFNSTLMECLNETYLNRYSLTDLQRVVNGNQYLLHFKLYPPQSLDQQARLFARYVLGIRPSDNPLTKTIKARNIQDLQDKIVDAYKYSYYKCIYHLIKMYREGFNRSITPNAGSYVFGGHHLMFHTAVKKYLRHVDLENSTSLLRRIDLYESDFSSFTQLKYDSDGSLLLTKDGRPLSNTQTSDGAVLSEPIIDLNQFDYFNPECEAILQDIHRNYSNSWVMDLGTFDPEDMENYSRKNPLGNTCYSEDGSLTYVAGSSKIADYPSKYLSIAVGLRLTIDSDSDIGMDCYDTVLTSELDPRGIFYEVYSVTGMLFGPNYLSGKSNIGDSSRLVDDTLDPTGGNSTTSLNMAVTQKPKRSNPGGSNNGIARKTLNRMSNSVNKLAKGIKSSTIDNKALKDYVGSIVKDVGVKTANTAIQAKALEMLTTRLAEKGISITGKSSNVKSGVPFLTYTQTKSENSLGKQNKEDKKNDPK